MVTFPYRGFGFPWSYSSCLFSVLSQIHSKLSLTSLISSQNVHTLWAFCHPLRVFWFAPVEMSYPLGLLHGCYPEISLQQHAGDSHHLSLVLEPFCPRSHVFLSLVRLPYFCTAAPPVASWEQWRVGMFFENLHVWKDLILFSFYYFYFYYC